MVHYVGLVTWLLCLEHAAWYRGTVASPSTICSVQDIQRLHNVQLEDRDMVFECMISMNQGVLPLYRF